MSLGQKAFNALAEIWLMRYYDTSLVSALMPAPPRTAHEEWLIGLRAIACYMGVSERTVRRWRDQHGMPIGNVPSGHVIASKQSIRDWVVVRGRMALEQRRNECPLNMTERTDHERTTTKA